MTRPTYDEEITALLVIDPYNDFISEGFPITQGGRATRNPRTHVRRLTNDRRVRARAVWLEWNPQ